MSRIIFNILLFISIIIRGPISILLIVFKNIVPGIRNRINFERKNQVEESCRSFALDGIIADYCFEVSSEGELEQVRPLLEFFLLKNKRIELIFSSPSVEKKCLKLASDNSQLIRLLRMPLASYFPFAFLVFQSPGRWVTASRIVFCRYDFFPELLILKYFGKKFILLSAANKKPSWFKTQVFSFFDIIVAATNSEEQFFKSHFPLIETFSFDFRVPRIFDRSINASKLLVTENVLTDYLIFLDSLTCKKCILGSVWPTDLDILKDEKFATDIKNGEIHLLVVPHQLSISFILELQNKLQTLFPEIPIYEIKRGGAHFDSEQFKKIPGIVILNMSGVLCELYTKFPYAYVGGGFERSIHSVLEPFLSGAVVFCGAKVHRSTEFDTICELAPNEIHLLKNPENFYTLFNEVVKSGLIKIDRQNLLVSSQKLKTEIINEIEKC